MRGRSHSWIAKGANSGGAPGVPTRRVWSNSSVCSRIDMARRLVLALRRTESNKDVQRRRWFRLVRWLAPVAVVPSVLLDLLLVLLLELLLVLLRVLEMPVALCGVDPGVSRENAWSGGAMCQGRSMLSGGRRMRA